MSNRLGRDSAASSGARNGGLGAFELLGLLWLHRYFIGAFVVGFTLLGLIYVATAPRLYTAQASLVIDSADEQLSAVDNSRAGPEHVAAVETQIQIIQSQRVALSIVRRLQLADSAEFFRPDSSGALQTMLGSLKAAATAAFQFLTYDPMEKEPAPPETVGEAIVATPAERAAVGTLRANLAIRRLGASHVIEVSYRSADPRLSATIANALTQAYIDDRRAARYDAAQNAGEWMENRISQLREQVSKAAREAQAFRAKNNLIQIGENGGLVLDHQLSQLNIKLIQAQSDMADATARLQRVQAALDQDQFDHETFDTSNNPVVTLLREQYISAANRVATAESRYGNANPSVQSAREEFERIRDSLRSELRRIANTLRSNAEIAQDRHQLLRDDLERLIVQAKATDEARVSLRQLEAISQAYLATYESYLKRYTQILQQQTAPILSARVINSAAEPSAPSSPPTKIALLLSAVLGGAIGVAATVIRSQFTQTIRSQGELTAAGLICLATIPELPRKIVHRIRELIQETVGLRNPAMRFVVELRRAAAQIRSYNKLRGITSVGLIAPDTGAGVSFLALAFAEEFAANGLRTLLVISDGRNVPQGSMNDVPFDTCFGHELISDEGALQVDFGAYGIVVFDLPPPGEFTRDTYELSKLVQTYIVILRWSRTRKESLQDTCLFLRSLDADLAGAVLTRTDVTVARMIDPDTPALNEPSSPIGNRFLAPATNHVQDVRSSL